MTDLAAPQAPRDAEAPTEPVLTQYHDTRRAGLAPMHSLAQTIETVLVDDAKTSKGRAPALWVLICGLKEDMAKKHMGLFPGMRAGGCADIEYPVAAMCGEYEHRAEIIALVPRITDGPSPPDHACGAGPAQYAGTGQLFSGMSAPCALENDLPFPHYARAS